MIFPADVRITICKAHNNFMDCVSLNSEASLLRDDEEDAEVIEKLNTIIRLSKEIIESKKQALRETIKKFESDFIKDVFENEEYYKMRIEED